MSDVDDFLLAYDQQLRTDAETPSATAVTRVGSLRLVTFEGGRGFVTYPRLYGDEAEQVPQLVAQVREHYRHNSEISRVEWKTRGHDGIPGLYESLVENWFEPEESESIMIGRAQLLDVDVPLPNGVALRRVLDAKDVHAMAAMEDAAFGSNTAEATARALLRRLAINDGMELWVAGVGGSIVAAGRLEPVEGTLLGVADRVFRWADILRGTSELLSRIPLTRPRRAHEPRSAASRSLRWKPPLSVRRSGLFQMWLPVLDHAELTQ